MNIAYEIVMGLLYLHHPRSAMRRAGELLKQIEPQPGRPSQEIKEGDHLN